MNDFDDIQKLWQQHTVKPDKDAAGLVRQIRQQRRREVSFMIWGNISLAISFTVILFVTFHYPFAYASTYIGIVLVLLSIIAAGVMNSRMLRLFYRSRMKEDTDNKTMLANLQQYQQRQRFFQTCFISGYYLALTAGIVLYMYELMHRDLLFMMIAYTITLGWLA